MSTATTDRFDELADRILRLDARAKVAPGQMGLDFTAAPKQESTGKPCGGGYINKDLNCRKEGEGQQPYRPTPQVKEGISIKPMSLNPGGDTDFDPKEEKKKAAGGLKYYRTNRGGPKYNYFFRDSQAAAHWLADDQAQTDADDIVGSSNRRSREWQQEYRAAYAATRNMLTNISDRELLSTVEGMAMAGKATSRGTAVDVRIGGNKHSRPIREGTFANSLADAGAQLLAGQAKQRKQLIKDLEAYGVEFAKGETDEILTNDLADMLEAQAMIAAQKRQQKPNKPTLASAQEVTTSQQQGQFARQQQVAAKEAGDERGAQAWRQEERKVENARIQAALSRASESQSSLFGVTEYDETMPLFRQRRDSTDEVGGLITAVLAESLPDAQVLDWSLQPKGVTAGRVASEGLVYRFRCDADSMAYRPAWEGIDERQWELRSEGFLAARNPDARLDFQKPKFQQQRSKRKCVKGYGCGSACIQMSKECRVQPSSAIGKQRLRTLQALAKEGDPIAADTAQRVQQERDQKAGVLREGRSIDKLKRLLEDPRVAEMVRTGKVPTADDSIKPGKVRDVDPKSVEVDPERFQYKIGASASGEVGSLSGVQKWDPNLAGVISVWQDPADGKTYVVNGHNRLALAKRLGAEEVTVRYLDAKDAKDARAIGAMQNIAEGAGKETDAAKFFRDSGITTEEEVKARGLPLNSGKASRGLALSKLPDEMFNDVIQGDLKIGRAAIIGGSGLDQDKQREVYKVLKKNKSMADGTLQEYVEQLAISERMTQTEIDIFGTSKKSVDTGLARAEATNTLKRELSRDARLLSAVSKSTKNVKILEEKGGNVINVSKSQQQAQEASSVLRIFDQLKNQSGPIKTALDKAAARITEGENKATVMAELRDAVIQGLEEEMSAFGLKKEISNEAESMSMFDAADPIETLSARLDYSIDQIEKWAQEMRGLRGSGGKIPTSRDLIRKQREETFRKGKESRGGRIPGPSGKGKPCGGSHIPAKHECLKDASEAYEPGQDKAKKPDFKAIARSAGKALAKALMKGKSDAA